VKIPLGDIIRAIAKPGSWLAKIFSRTKGVSLGIGGHEVQLDERHGVPGSGESPLDRPHRPGR
jgi:hypothetical protein